MPNFVLTMSARKNGEFLITSYPFQTNTLHSEADILRDFREFYPNLTDVNVISMKEATSEHLILETF